MDYIKSNYNKDIFREVERVENRRNRIMEEKKQNLINKLKIYTTMLAIAGSVTFTVVKINEVKQPLHIVTHDIMANEGYSLSDNGKSIDPKMFGKNDKEALFQYVRENHIKPEELEKSLEKYLINQGFGKNKDEIMNEIMDEYDRAFGMVNFKFDETKRVK